MTGLHRVRQVYLMIAWVRQVYLIAWVRQVYLIAWVRQVSILAWVSMGRTGFHPSMG